MSEYILFAHSDAETRSILYEVFTKRGYKITTLPTHKDIIDILNKERPGYIFLDPNITDIPAKAALDKIKAIDNNVEVIILGYCETRPELINYIIKILRPKQEPKEPEEETKRRPQEATILVVDDEQETLDLLKKYLSRKGYNVDIASSAEEAITKTNTLKPDVVLMDIRMKGLDGMVALKRIKAIDKSIIVIMTTAIGNDDVINESLKLGANDYLVKPFNLDKLEAAILNAIWHKYL
jgi:DNA-binding response OmpR family regulator